MQQRPPAGWRNLPRESFGMQFPGGIGPPRDGRVKRARRLDVVGILWRDRWLRGGRGGLARRFTAVLHMAQSRMWYSWRLAARRRGRNL